jgi:hypothetical protein
MVHRILSINPRINSIYKHFMIYFAARVFKLLHMDLISDMRKIFNS